MEKEETTSYESLPIRISNNAHQNINEITGNIAFVKYQPLNAMKVGDAIFAVIDRIEENPWAFKECDQITTKKKIYRQAICLSWLIVYKITSSEILV